MEKLATAGLLQRGSGDIGSNVQLRAWTRTNGSTLTAQEVRAQCVNTMPNHLGELYFELRNQLALLHLKWHDYRRLYADGLETINLLNEAASGFFYNLQRMMWEDVQLHLCRITDRQRSGGKETLTIRRLKRELSGDEFHNLRKKVEAQVKKACQKIDSFARPLRNRRLAHRELPPSEGESPQPLADASRQDVETALADLRDTMHIIESHFLDSETAYEYSMGVSGGVEFLLSRLRIGVAARRAELVKPMGSAER